MKHSLKWKLLLPLLPLLIIAGILFQPTVGKYMGIYVASANSQDTTLARNILNNPRIVLSKSHLRDLTDKVYCTGKIDHSTAYCNIVELANGQNAARSRYRDPSVGSSGPGGSTPVQSILLRIILAAAASGHEVGVGEIAGGVHPAHTSHYAGRAIDFSTYNGQQLSGRNQASISFIQAILSLLPSGSGIGQSQCGPMPSQLAKSLQSHHISTFPDSCGHLHIQVP